MLINSGRLQNIGFNQIINKINKISIEGNQLGFIKSDVLVLDEIRNFATMMSFETGEMNILMVLKDETKKIKYNYNLRVDYINLLENIIPSNTNDEKCFLKIQMGE